MNENEYQQFVEDVAHRIVDMQTSNCPVPMNPCANVLFSEITIERFYRSGQTLLDQKIDGNIPIVPGQSATLEQKSHPGWSASCFRLTYRLANNGTNHQDVEIRFFIDGIELDKIIYGSDIYDNANHMIGDGFLPLPLANGRQCCIGAMNKLQVKITHTGAANQIEQPRIYVNHGPLACCSACAGGKSCQNGCKNHQPRPNGNGNGQPKPVPMLQGMQGGQQVIVLKQP